MSGYVLQRVEDGKYMTHGEHSYTNKLEEAFVFATRAGAEKDRCSNERIIPLGGLIQAREYK